MYRCGDLLLIKFDIAHDLYVLHQRNIYSLSDVEGLKEYIIFLSFVKETIYLIGIECLLFNSHEGLYIF